MMQEKKENTSLLNENIEKLNKMLVEMNIHDLVYILGNRKEIFVRNIWAGVWRGIGIGIGVTIITAAIVLILQKIVTLNIPVIGQYISDIVEIVQKNLR